MSLRILILVVTTALIAAVSTGCGNENTVLPIEDTDASADDTGLWNIITVTGSVVNLRGGPGTEFAVLGQVARGDSLQVTGGLEDWYRVYVPHLSLFGWIYGPLTSGIELPQ